MPPYYIHSANKFLKIKAGVIWRWWLYSKVLEVNDIVSFYSLDYLIYFLYIDLGFFLLIKSLMNEIWSPDLSSLKAPECIPLLWPPDRFTVFYFFAFILPVDYLNSNERSVLLKKVWLDLCLYSSVNWLNLNSRLLSNGYMSPLLSQLQTCVDAIWSEDFKVSVLSAKS